MSSKGGSPYNPQVTPNYLQAFSKALAVEVRILLAEVGKLRDERTQLQNEIAELMSLRAKHGGGYVSDWRPRIEPPPPMGMEDPPMPPAAMIVIEDAPQARPGWRKVQKRPERKPRKAITAPPAAAPTPPPMAYEPPPPPNMPAWAQWRPNPLLAPTPLVSPTRIPATPPPRAGLFGACTPPPGGR